MTTKNAKTMLMLAVTVTLFVPVAALAANDNQTVGKTVIKTEISKNVPDKILEKLQQLDEKRNNTTSDDERDQIQKQMDALMQEAQGNRPIIDAQRRADYELKVEQLTNGIAAERKNISSDDKERVIPFTTISFDESQNALAVGIHKDYATTENMGKYTQKIQNILGNDVDLVVYNGGDYWQLGACASRTSNLTQFKLASRCK